VRLGVLPLRTAPAHHFLRVHGAGYVPKRAAYDSGRPFIVAVVNLGSGSAVYENEFRDESTFPRLVEMILITHSEIFPGSYASTTETADYLINALHLQRHAVLKSGPAGMQMLSETHRNGLTILAFAGNTAPDHIDHFHGLPVFLKMVLDCE
jgi:hypothetical protein